MSIKITNLTKKYDDQTVLNNISFSIGEGEIVGFLGPNGAGKTTTMKIIAGALSYDQGSVKVCDLEVNDNRLESNALIGYLPEQNPQYTEMYIKEYLLFIADTYKLGKDKNKQIEELIDKVGLRPEIHKKIGQLSKGYRQRVGLAQALMPNPRVLILDEPTTGLDPNQLEEIRNLIRETGKDRTVLLSTHIMQEIKAICNRVIVINKGEIAADFTDLTKIQTLDQVAFRFEIELLNAVDINSLKSLKDVQTVHSNSETYYTIFADKDIREDLFDFAKNNNNKLLLIKPVEQSMEDIFKILTT